MADDGSQYPRIPTRLPDWQELNRRTAAFSAVALERIEELERRVQDHEQRIAALENPGP